MPLDNMAEFDEIQALKGLAHVVGNWVGDDLARFKVEAQNQEWIDSTEPAVYLGMPDVPSPDFPRIYLTYQGDNNEDGFRFDQGLVEIDDPDNVGETITVPYTTTLINFAITLTCECGDVESVYRGERKASGKILRTIRDNFNFEDNRNEVYDAMNATINQIAPIISSKPFIETKFRDTSTMLVGFSGVNTLVKLGDDGWFNTVVVEGCLQIDETDPNPITSEITIGPIT